MQDASSAVALRDAEMDQSATRMCSDVAAGSASEDDVRKSLVESALTSHILSQAVYQAVDSMGSCSAQKLEDRTEWVTGRVRFRLIRCIQGPDPILDLSQIADGVRFSTWLRRVAYPTCRNLSIDRYRYEQVRRKVNIRPLDEEILPQDSSPDDVLRRNHTEALWQSFMEERPKLRGNTATVTEAWYLSQVLGLRDLQNPRLHAGQEGVTAQLIAAPAASIRQHLQQQMSGTRCEHDMTLALASMTRRHTSEQIQALIDCRDVVLEHLVRAALVPVSSLGRKEIVALQQSVAAVIYPHNRPVSPQRPVKLRATNRVVMTWAAYICHTTSASPLEFKTPQQQVSDRDAFLLAVGDMLATGATGLGLDAASIDHHLDAILTRDRVAARSGHTA